ncbi:MAG: hypothetical protein U0800_08215 [Isosphaeraceae bacterium]
MHRMPLSDELPYRFLPPRLNPTLFRLTRPFRDRMLRGAEHRIEGIEFDGLEPLRELLGRGDGVLICPNHCGRADGLVMLAMADRLGRPFCRWRPTRSSRATPASPVGCCPAWGSSRSIAKAPTRPR